MNAIYYNCRIYPQYRVRKRPSVLVVTGDKITAIGHDFSSIYFRFGKHRPVDLKGRIVTPGLVDSHTHFYFWAATLDTVHLNDTVTFDDALKRILKFSKSCGSDEWIIGDGWSADRWQKYHLPTAHELDSATGGRPAALFSKDQHLMWVNSRALDVVGIDKHYPDPEGGQIDRDYSGQPTGILREAPAYAAFLKFIDRPDPKRLERSWKKAAQTVYARGVTGFHSFDHNPDAFEYFSRLHRQKKLGFRVHYYFPVSMLDELIEKKIKSGLGDETLQTGGVKIFADGSLGAQTALMKKPYLGTRKGCGVETTTAAELKRLAVKASAAELACAIHAIGDQAVSNVISAFEAIPNRTALRHRIEHLQIISRSDIPRLKRVGAVASMQPSHCPSDRGLVASYWGARCRNAYIFRTLLNKIIPLAFGSDCPIEPLDPIAGIHAAVNRTGYGERGGKFYPEESLTVAQAVYGFTAGSAYAAGREDHMGKISPGYPADLVIFDDDIYSMPPSRLFQAKVGATIFAGKPVYNSGSIDTLG